METTSLSDLCAICHTSTPKYRCPRCRTQTCSLPCSKRHKQRASCNGQRDPTTYLKKSQWATPAGLDHDYNYLRSVEKSIDHAGEDSQARGIAMDNPSGRHRHAARVAGSALQTYLTENRITVDRAPLGMHRQKINRTRVSARRNVLWTVEWVLPDGSRRVSDASMGSETIAECFARVRADVLKLDQSTKSVAGNKRKRAKAKAALKRDEPRSSSQVPYLSTDQKDLDESARPSPAEQSDRPDQPDPPDQKPHPDQLNQRSPPSDSESSSTTTTIITEPRSSTTTSLHSPPNPLNYYLLLPKTPLQTPVLIPLAPSTTLTATLRDRVVLEFPTIYALHHPPDALPEEFVLEEEYLKMMVRKGEGKGMKADGEGGRDGKALGEDGKGGRDRMTRELDASSILEMLKRDVSR